MADDGIIDFDNDISIPALISWLSENVGQVSFTALSTEYWIGYNWALFGPTPDRNSYRLMLDDHYVRIACKLAFSK